MKDFTLTKYRELLETLKRKNYAFMRFDDYITNQHSSDILPAPKGSATDKADQQSSMNDKTQSPIPPFFSSIIPFFQHSCIRYPVSSIQNPVFSTQSSTSPIPLSPYPPIPICILRHDVDRLPENSLAAAKVENELGIRGSYYFRIVPESFDETIIRNIADLGHEVGYHYEDVDLVSRGQKSEFRNQNGKVDKDRLVDAAYESFCRNLELFRKNFEIKTICMHGSPRSKYDNKIIWEKYNYRDLGITGEPYFDINWNVFGYLTDTGRCWNGNRVSIRDKVNSRYEFDFKGTADIIRNIDKLPDIIMFTIHPERWNSSFVSWTRELIWQNLKNAVKRVIIIRSGRKGHRAER